MKERKIIKAHCNVCFGEKRHEVLHIEEFNHTEQLAEDVFWYSGQSFELLKCAGCESVKLRHKRWHSEDYDAEGNERIHVTYYPPSVSRREPEWLSSCGDFRTPELLFNEVYIALQNNCRRLAAMGVRSVIEHIMIEKVGDNGSFRNNLNNLEAAGFISKKQAEALGSIIEAGNATTHRGFEPSEEDLTTLLDIAESLYETVYIHPQQADSLKKRIPPRTK